MKPSGAIREGEDILICHAESDLALHFTRFRETDAAIRTLVTPVTIETRQRALAPMMVNLFTKSDREKLTTAICDRIEGANSPLKSDWSEFVEIAFATVVDMTTTPEPLVNLADVEAPPDQGALIAPSLLLRGQINVILADQKSGKSYDVLMLAVAVATGRSDLLPTPLQLIGNGGPVIYYDSETDWTAQRRRLERVAAGLHLPRLPDIHYRRLRPPLVDRAGAMQAEIARLGAVMVIVDSLTFSTGGSLNDPEVSGPTMIAIGELGEGVTKVLTAHHAKASRSNGERPSIIGSGLFEMKARNIWLIKRESEAGEDHIDQAWSHEWINDGRQETGFGLRLSFNESNTRVTFDSISAKQSQFIAQRTGTQKERVLAAVIHTDLLKAGTRAIASATGIREENVAKYARQLIEEGKLKLIEGGRGKGQAVYAAVNADRPEQIITPNEIITRQTRSAPEPSTEINNQRPTPRRGGADDYFRPRADAANNQANNQEIISDYFDDDDDGWIGAR